MSEPSQWLGCWVVKFPAAKESRQACVLTFTSQGHLEAPHSACPAQHHPTMDRTCWQPAPGSLSPSLSKVCTAGSHGSWPSKDFDMQFKGLEKGLPCSEDFSRRNAAIKTVCVASLGSVLPFQILCLHFSKLALISQLCSLNLLV